jgi:manganese/iron transport system ATP-binding protein/manganese/zinc/iron transport system ATP- binding protein
MTPRDATASQMRASGALVDVRELAAAYDGRLALAGVTFTAHAGERLAVLGPNGGGKSTLFRTLLGDVPVASGEIRRLPRCATVPQTERSRLDYPVSALDVALMGTLSRLPWWRRPGRGDRRAAIEALDRVGLADRAPRLFGELSGGQRQRVLIARALVQDAPVLLLDEPFSGVDSASADVIERLLADLAAEGRTLLIATHDIDQARRWDRVLCLNVRQVAHGAPADVLTRDVLERTYGGAIVALPGGAGDGVLPPFHHHHADRAR